MRPATYKHDRLLPNDSTKFNPTNPTECPDYRWSYSGSAPLPSELAPVLASLLQEAQQARPGQLPAMLRLERFYGGHKNGGGGPAANGSGGSAANGGAAAAKEDLGPLPPHVCSLALLPGNAGGYVPADFRWLMEEGSPVYDLYKECKVGARHPCHPVNQSPGRHLAHVLGVTCAYGILSLLPATRLAASGITHMSTTAHPPIDPPGVHAPHHRHHQGGCCSPPC